MRVLQKSVRERKVSVMNKNRKRLALLTAAMVLFVVLASIFFVAGEAGHDCVGRGCTVCEQLSACEKTLESLGFAACAAAFAVVLTYFPGAGTPVSREFVPIPTLVSLKVKLLN